MGVEDANKAMIVRFNKEVIEGRNAGLFHEIVAPDFKNRTPRDPRSDGPDGALRFFMTILPAAFPDRAVTIHDQIAEGDEVVTRKSYAATHEGTFLGVPATGKRVQFTVIDVIRLCDGRYVEHRANADMAGLMKR